MTFNTMAMDRNNPATTTSMVEGFSITFNNLYINDDGWNDIAKKDNIDYDWSKVQTKEEALVVYLAHETQHANHTARFFDAMKQAEQNSNEAVNILLKNGYSQDYVDIFFHQVNGKWERTPTDKAVDNMHDYMKKYNHGVIDAALDEYRRDFNQ